MSGISGFWSREGKAAVDVPALQAELATLRQENAKLQDSLQKSEVEKGLLKNLVDQAYLDEGAGADAEDTKASALLGWQAEKAELLAAKEAHDTELASTRKALATEEKKVKVFSEQVERMQAELKSNDAEIAELRSHATDYDALVDKERRASAELEATQATVCALMERVNKADSLKQQTEKDLTAIVSKTAQSASESGEELARKTEQLSEAQSELARLKAALVAAERDADTRIAAAKVDADSAAKLHEANARIESLKGQCEEAGAECEALHSAVDSMEATNAALKHSLEEATQAVEAAEREQQHLRDTIEQHVHQLTAAADEIESLRSERETLSQHVIELRQEAEAAHQTAATAQRELDATIEAANIKQQELEDQLRSRDLHARSVDERIADIEASAQIKLRMNAALVKELQQQLARAERERSNIDTEETRSVASLDDMGSNRSSAGAFHGSTLHAENLKLIDKIAAQQREVWEAQTARTDAEVQLQRAQAQLADKTAIIKAHFVDAAKRGSKAIGSSIFGPKDTEIMREVQERLEVALRDNMHMQHDVHDLRRELAEVQEALDRAVLQGFDPYPLDDVDPDGADAVAGADVHDGGADSEESDWEVRETPSKPVRPPGVPPLPGLGTTPRQTPGRALGRGATPRTVDRGAHTAAMVASPLPSHMMDGDGFE